MPRTLSLTVVVTTFLVVCFFAGGKFHRSALDPGSGLEAAGLGVLALIGLWGIAEVIGIIRWNLRGGEPPPKRRKGR
jgi:hypothetical protein